MSLAARRELTSVTRQRYRLADRTEKARILDEFALATTYHRKYAITVLSKPEEAPRRKGVKPTPRTRKRQYDKPVERALAQLWEESSCLCSKRLVPFLPELLEALERHGELDGRLVTPEVRGKLLTLSAATCDRLLGPHRRASPLYGKSTTKPGTLLKHQIPIRTFADWTESEKRPGFCEIDLVAHCGDSAAGEFVHTLTVTDVFTGWTECQAIVNRSQLSVSEALEAIRTRLPFALLGIDSDNGSEFINAHLLRYCEKNKLTFTRCRPYKKNDQCHVEQKNWTVVRQTVGYSRMEGDAFLHLLFRIYIRHRLFLNFFQPSLKLTGKERSGAHVKKTYDTAQTPYRRLHSWLEAQGEDAFESRTILAALYQKLNPAEIRRQIEAAQKALAERCIQARAEGRLECIK
jgi:hypothetical protein